MMMSGKFHFNGETATISLIRFTMVKLSYALFALLGSNDVASAFTAKPKAFGSSTQLQMVSCVDDSFDEFSRSVQFCVNECVVGVSFFRSQECAFLLKNTQFPSHELYS